MKSYLKSSEVKIEYPCLMIQNIGPSTGSIIFFYKEKSGIVIYSTDNGRYIGEQSDSWTMTAFEPYFGSVTLEN